MTKRGRTLIGARAHIESMTWINTQAHYSRIQASRACTRIKKRPEVAHEHDASARMRTQRHTVAHAHVLADTETENARGSPTGDTGTRAQRTQRLPQLKVKNSQATEQRQVGNHVTRCQCRASSNNFNMTRPTTSLSVCVCACVQFKNFKPVTIIIDYSDPVSTYERGRMAVFKAIPVFFSIYSIDFLKAS